MLTAYKLQFLLYITNLSLFYQPIRSQRDRGGESDCSSTQNWLQKISVECQSNPYKIPVTLAKVRKSQQNRLKLIQQSWFPKHSENIWFNSHGLPSIQKTSSNHWKILSKQNVHICGPTPTWVKTGRIYFVSIFGYYRVDEIYGWPLMTCRNIISCFRKRDSR